MLKEPTLLRSASLTNTEVTSDSERSATMETMKLKTSPQTKTGRSSSLLQLSKAEIELLSQTLQKEQRSILVVKTQQESLKGCLDDRSSCPAEGGAATSPTVTFGKLHIREYARRPGDNPGCRLGVSLTIDWQVQDEQSIDLEAYEESRPTRRDRSELNIPSDTRMQMLRDSGYSRNEILSYVKMANIARGQRSRTNETLQLAGAEELAQRFVRGFLNKSVHRSKKKKEKKLIEESRAKDQTLLVLRRQSAKQAVDAPPVAPKRRVKRDSLAIMAPAAPDQQDTASVSSSDDTTTEAEEELESLPLPLAPMEAEIEC